MMGGHPRPKMLKAGFTIVETMIVLAVTGLLFVSFTTAIAGRQGKVRFQQSVTQVKNDVIQAISDSQSGYYPTQENFTCTVGASLTFNIGAKDQGTNDDCIYLGTVLQFSTATDPQKMFIHSLAGKEGASSFDDSLAKIIPQTTQTKLMESGLTVRWMRAVNGVATQDVAAVALMSNFKLQSNGLMQGSPTTQVVAVKSTQLTDTDATNIDANIDDSYTTPFMNPDKGVQICLQSGTTDQSGLIVIGGKGRENAVTLNIKDTKDCS
jgi:type II secretory pathway pseudopilin PulG